MNAVKLSKILCKQGRQVTCAGDLLQDEVGEVYPLYVVGRGGGGLGGPEVYLEAAHAG